MIQFLIGAAVFLVVAPIVLAVPVLVLAGLLLARPWWVLAGVVIWAVSYPIYHKVQYGHWPGG